MNLVTLVGNLGNDPDLQYTNAGTPVCNFTMATSKRWKDDAGENREKTSWHRISVFGKTAENCKRYIEKGSKVAVIGEIDYQEYEKDGERKFSTKIIAKSVEFLNSKKDSDNGNSGYNPPPKKENNSGGNYPDDDIPF